MTLCIAWRQGNQVSFASDSRISKDKDHFADIGVKIMEVPVRITGPIQVETGTSSVLYEQRIGFCYCGDTIHAHFLKEIINEVFQSLQIFPMHTDFSMNGIKNLVERFFTVTANELKDGFKDEFEIEFLLGGFCPLEKRIIVYKFGVYDDHGRLKARSVRVLENNPDMIILGSGQIKANQIIARKLVEPGPKLLKVLREVCLDETETSVGGHIQYGAFKEKDFKIFGIADYEIADGQLKHLYIYRGIKLYEEDFARQERDFHIAQKFITPFQDEIDEYIKS